MAGEWHVRLEILVSMQRLGATVDAAKFAPAVVSHGMNLKKLDSAWRMLSSACLLRILVHGPGACHLAKGVSRVALVRRALAVPGALRSSTGDRLSQSMPSPGCITGPPDGRATQDSTG